MLLQCSIAIGQLVNDLTYRRSPFLLSSWNPLFKISIPMALVVHRYSNLVKKQKTFRTSLQKVVGMLPLSSCTSHSYFTNSCVNLQASWRCSKKQTDVNRSWSCHFWLAALVAV
jgi:hypothetical protein